jgi:DICT domain-containing protein
LLQEEAIIFVCGDASRMAPDVRRAFSGIFRAQTGASESDAQAWLTGLVQFNPRPIEIAAPYLAADHINRRKISPGQENDRSNSPPV